MSPRLLLIALATIAAPAFAQTVPAGYPADYAQTIAAAKKEGKVVIYSALDTKAAQPLIKDFNALYPDIKVEYNDMNSTEMYNRFIAESASGQGGADVMWSSAMDLQVKLVDDGKAMPYASPEAAKLPAWANYKNEAYGTTYEPAVFIYNKRLVTGNEIPQDHAAFAKLLNGDTAKFKNKVTTYDIEKSGVGFMFVVQDAKYFPGMKDLEKGFGATSYKVYASTGNMLEKVSSGEHLLGYNVLGSYALVRAKKDPNLGVVLPKDYTLILSRVIFIGKGAKDPSAAKLWVDYILSPRGQKMIGGEVELFSIRTDVQTEYTAASLNKELGQNAVKPIPVSSEITQWLDPKKRLEFLSEWKKGLAAGSAK
ncbi:MAG TPA: ABC transporter substrate-binding protein [Gemmatimonadaceae bacterium]|jgi:iron(III) transport system substrate-binding protein|nr:ABC transporter substrate-binding protein [Casimicrobiaceae bacterium]